MLTRTQRGDTLIEVLMAIMILSAVVSGAYMIANRSMTYNRQSQERSQATKVMESQFERIKFASRATVGSTAKNGYLAFVNNPGSAGCFNSSLVRQPASCSIDNRYTVTTTFYSSAQKDASNQPLSTANVFKVSVVWPDKGGDKNVTGYYRVFNE